MDASNQLKTAEDHIKSVGEWQKTLAEVGEAVPLIPQDAVDQATLAVVAARNAVEAGVGIRNAKSKLVKRDEHLDAAQTFAAKAVSLRGAAAQVDSILSLQVAKLGCPLRVDGGRLVTDTDRGVEFYDDLSHGEKCEIAIDIAAGAVGEGGLFVISQEMWAAANERMHQEFADRCKKNKVTAVTAELRGDEPLTAEVFGAEPVAADPAMEGLN